MARAAALLVSPVTQKPTVEAGPNPARNALTGNWDSLGRTSPPTGEKVRVMRKYLAAAVCAAAVCAPLAVPTQPASAQMRTATTAPPATKILVFVEENHSLSQMKAGMPYAYSLAKRYGYATNYTAITHPSLPNYLAIAAGRTYGVRDNLNPSAHKLTGHTVFGQAIAAGKTAATYADGMPSNCSLVKGGTAYVPKHNPWAYFVDERALCRKFDLPISKLGGAITTGKLPNVGMVIPNLRHDAHDGSLGTADNWFKAWMTKIAAGPDWKAGRLVVVLTADEDNRISGNKVLTIVIHPSQHARVVTTRLTHYSLTRLFEEVAGTKFQHYAATAPSMRKAFGLPVAPTAAAPTVVTASVQRAITSLRTPLAL